MEQRNATVTVVGDSATNVTLLSERRGRIATIIYNNSSAVMYVKFGATATTSDFSFRLLQHQWEEIAGSFYNGRIDAIWASDAGGSANVTEII